MDFFKRLMLARQLSFTEGRIELMKQGIVMVPSEFFGKYILEANEDKEAVYKLYYAGKEIMREKFGIDMGKSYGFGVNEYSTWFVDIAKLSGWGNIKWEARNEKNHNGIISILNSPIANYAMGKVKSPCDHVIRGLMAGGASSAFVDDVDIIETECIALGNKSCTFIIDHYKTLKKKFPKLVEQQLGEK